MVLVKEPMFCQWMMFSLSSSAFRKVENHLEEVGETLIWNVRFSFCWAYRLLKELNTFSTKNRIVSTYRSDPDDEICTLRSNLFSAECRVATRSFNSSQNLSLSSAEAVLEKLCEMEPFRRCNLNRLFSRESLL